MLGMHQLKVDDLLIDETVYCTHTHMKVHIKYCPLNLLSLIFFFFFGISVYDNQLRNSLFPYVCDSHKHTVTPTHEHMHEHMHASTDTVT